MATVLDEVSIKGLRKAHFDQLLSYINECDREGWYYGNRGYFIKRHAEIKEWVEGILRQAEGNIIPKKE
jgi:hypothetical protein